MDKLPSHLLYLTTFFIASTLLPLEAHLGLNVWFEGTLLTIVGIGVLVLPLVGLITLVIGLSSPHKRQTTRALVYLSALVSGLVSIALTRTLRFAALEETARTGDAIVAAVEAYYRGHGKYPPTLDALATEHLAAVPEPALRSCDDFDYRLETYRGMTARPWHLRVNCISPLSISAILTYAPELSPGPFRRSAAWAWD